MALPLAALPVPITLNAAHAVTAAIILAVASVTAVAAVGPLVPVAAIQH